MGFNREQIKVFLYLHDALNPTTKERLGMLDSYCGLIENNQPTVVRFAFETLQSLDKDARLDERQLCDVLRATMRSPTKTMVKATLKWLGNLSLRNQESSPAACLSATEGLLHEKPDVQAEAWKFIEKHGSQSEDLVEELSRLVDTTSASVKKQIKKWLAENSTQSSSDTTEESTDHTADLDAAIALAKKTNKKLAPLLGIPELLKVARSNERHIPPCSFDGTELSRLWNCEKLEPIQSLEELVEVAALVLEDGSLVEDAERVLEALTRFPVAGDAAALKTADPIIKRAIKRSARAAPFYGAGADHDLVPVIEAWSGIEKRIDDLKQLYKTRDEKDHQPPGLTGFMGYRSRAVMKRFIDKKPLQLLSTPTHVGSWIDPMALSKRSVDRKEVSESGR